MTNQTTVETLLTELHAAEFDLSIIAHDENAGEHEIISSDAAYEYMLTHYAGYHFYYSNLFGRVESFRITWASFLMRNQGNLDRQYQALTAQYNPVQNYDMTETETTETANGGTVTTETDGTKTQTGTISDNGASSSEGNIYGYNSGTGVDSDSVSGTSTNTRTHNLSYGDNTTNTETRDTSTETTRTLSRAGNIGVTAGYQMVQGEIETRKFDIAIEFLRRFAYDYLHYIGACDFWRDGE